MRGAHHDPSGGIGNCMVKGRPISKVIAKEEELNFIDIVRKSIKPEPPETKWFYVSARYKDGSFAGAIFIEATDSVAAALKGTRLIGTGLVLGERAEVPSGHLPPEQ